MNRRITLAVAGALTLSVAIAVFVRARRATADAQAALIVARHTAGGLAKSRQRLAKQVADDRGALADFKARPPALPRAATMPNPGLEKLENDPALQAKLLAAKRARLGSLYGPLFGALKLNAEQIKALEAAIMERESSNLDLDFAAGKAGSRVAVNTSALDPIQMMLEPLRGDGSDSPDLVAAHRLADQISEKFQASATAILGQADEQQLEQYEQTLPQRNFVNDFNGQLSSAGHPLSPQQVDGLTHALVAANKIPAGMPMVSPLATADYDSLLGQAKAVLGPEQYEALQRQVAQPRAADQFLQGVRAAAGLNP